MLLVFHDISLLPFIPWTYPRSFNTPPWEVMSFVGGATHKEGGWRWEFHHQGLGTQGTFQSCFISEVQYPLGTVCLVSLQDTPHNLGSGDLGLMQRAAGSSGPSKGGSSSGTSSQTPSDPGHCNIGTQAYSGAGDVTSTLVTIPEGNGVSISFPLF